MNAGRNMLRLPIRSLRRMRPSGPLDQAHDIQDAGNPFADSNDPAQDRDPAFLLETDIDPENGSARMERQPADVTGAGRPSENLIERLPHDLRGRIVDVHHPG